jgi:peptidoglycan/xylan/chitin deacetylase (PgdA/CDA1 family)
VEEGGFLYDSDCYNDELPYWTTTKGRRHLVVPFTLAINDSKYGRAVFATADDFFTYAKDSFDLLLREGVTQPKMMSVGLHLRITGHPGRATGLERFLDYVLAQKDVWICRREEIARHWIAHHSVVENAADPAGDRKQPRGSTAAAQGDSRKHGTAR